MTTATTVRQQLEVALNPRRVLPLLRAFANSSPGYAGSKNNRAQHGSARDACHILDAKYEPGSHCSILYEVCNQLIIGELAWPTGESTEESNAGKNNIVDAELLPNMTLYPFERDPGMPTLTTAMDGNAMQQLLNAALPECTAGAQRILRCRVTRLRYRLGKRCTLRYDLRLRAIKSGLITTRTLYGKLYHSADKAKAVYDEMQLLADAQPLLASANRTGHARGNGHAPKQSKLVVAKAVAYLPSLPMVLQAPVEDSAPLELLLQQPPNAHQSRRSEVTAGIRRAATALAELHQSTMRTDRIRSVDAELKKLARRSSRIADMDVVMGADMYQLAQALSASRVQLSTWDEEVTVVHGDCKPSQFFLLPDGTMALLDFDHCGMADPAADVGNFLATLRQMGIKQILKQRAPVASDAAATDSSATDAGAWQRWLATLETAFLDDYVAGRPCHADFRRRAIWYQAMALWRKALRSYARSSRSPLPLLLVQEAWRVLEAC